MSSPIDQAADDGARDRVEAAEDDDGEDDETERRRGSGSTADEVGEEHTGDERADRGERPGQREDPPHGDAHGQRGLLVVGDARMATPCATALEEGGEGDEHDGGDADDHEPV